MFLLLASNEQIIYGKLGNISNIILDLPIPACPFKRVNFLSGSIKVFSSFLNIPPYPINLSGPPIVSLTFGIYLSTFLKLLFSISDVSRS